MNQLSEKTQINLGDKRLNDPYAAIEAAAFKEPSKNIPGILHNRDQTKAVYRFFDNPKVTEKELLEHHCQQTKTHIKNWKKRTKPYLFKTQHT